MTRIYTLIRDDSQANIEASITTVGIADTKLPCGNYPVILSVQYTKQDALEYLNGLGADLDVISENSYSAMHWAVVNNDSTALDYLITNGADINIKQVKFASPFTQGNTPLGMAATRSYNTLMQTLIDASANVDLKNTCLDTALHLCSRRANSTGAQKLIDASANVDLINNAGNTPLHVCAIKDDTTIAQKLVDAGANKATTNNDGDTAADLSGSAGMDTILA